MEKSPISTTSRKARLLSLDALRGFDMFWIIGGDKLVISLATLQGLTWLQPAADQMRHVPWEGFHFYDLIFPLFMFISGVAIPYAITSKVEKGASKNSLLLKIIKRGLVLVVFGIIYNGALQHGFENARYASVLGQIGIAYVLAAAIVLFNRSMVVQGLWLTAILGIIALLQLVVPVPGYGAGNFDGVMSFNAWLDQLLLPGRLIGGTFDNEGILNVISASTVTLTGALAGGILRNDKISPYRKTLVISISGLVLVGIALLLSPFYPIIKNMWTVPFNLLTAGLSALFLSLFYFLIDVKNYNRGIGAYIVFFFSVIGLNSITIYMGAKIISFSRMSTFFLGWLSEPLGEWIIILGVIVLEWLFLYYLYKRNLFLKV